MSAVARRQISRAIAADAALDAASGGNVNILPRQPRQQTVAYAATLTVDPSLGSTVIVGALTGNITIAAPTNPEVGDKLTFCFVQDGTGNRTITWNAVFVTTPTTVLTATTGRTKGNFVYTGTVWLGG